MKHLLFTFLLSIIVSTTAFAIEIDTLWYRTMGAGADKVDFTPDDKYVIAWANGIEFWEVEQGVKEFFIPSEATGDFNFNEQYLVFAQDSTPKLLDWKTKEVVEGFEKEKENFGRIMTAKSKNEFMVNTYHEDFAFGDIVGNSINFYNIDSKRKVDSIVFLKQFEKGGYKWKRTLHEYDYVGNNDEFIYVVIDDANDVLQNIPPTSRNRHYSVHFYNIETKELVDSIYLFSSTSTNKWGINKLQVMKDRTKIAWNNKGGEINFYDFNTKNFYNKIIFDESDFIPATDIEFNNSGRFMAVTQANACCRYIKIYELETKELVYYSNIGGKENVSFSNDDKLLVASVSSFLLLFPSHIGTTSIENQDDTNLILNVNPNPASNSINISFNSPRIEQIKLSIIDLVGNEIGIIDEGLLNTQHYMKEYNVSNLPSGAYFIRLEIGDDIITQKFIKE